MITRFGRGASQGSVSAALFLLASAQAPAWSQTTPAAASDAADAAIGIDDIVVLARRREESLQAVPVSITAFSGAELERKGIQSTYDLQKFVPGIVFNAAGTEGNPTFTIRGQGKDVVGPGLPSVISYLNEVPLPSWGSALPTYDVSSIQVLKGPQGTLFGRNTTGGAVLVYSAPAVDTLEGYGRITVGDYNWREFEGAVNLPLSPVFALRVAGNVVKRDGYVKDIGVSGDQANLNSRAFRVTLKIQPTDDISNVTIYDYFRSHTNGTGFVTFAPATPFPFYRFFPGLACGTSSDCDVDLAIAEQRARGDRVANTNLKNISRTRIQGLSNTTTVDFGGVTLKNIFGWRDNKVFQQGDSDSLKLAVIDTQTFHTDRQLTNELQFSGTLMKDRLSWLIGGFYLDSKPTGPNGIAINLFDAGNNPLLNSPALSNMGNYLYSDRSKAVFGSLQYQVIDGLKVNGAARYTKDRQSVCAAKTAPWSVGIVESLSDCNARADHFNASEKSSATTYTFGAEYQLNRSVFTYVTVRKGYRGGGINTPVFGGSLVPFQTFSPQTVNDVELGAKTQWRIDEVVGRFNVAVFRGKFKDLQRQATGLAPDFDGDGNAANDPDNTSLVINSGSARVQGVEIDGLIRPVPNLTLNYGLSYLDAKFTSLEVPPLFAGQSGSSAIYSNTPKWSYSLSGRYELPFELSGAQFALNADYVHVGRYYTGIVSVPSYGVANVSFDITNIGSSALGITFFVNNITDKTYLRNTLLNGASPGPITFSLGEPRMWGVRARWDFGG